MPEGRLPGSAVKPVNVSVDVPTPREEVYDFLHLLSNHASFRDYLLTDWKYSGPPSGVGARARARANTPMSQDWTDIELIVAERPRKIVEEDRGAKGRRRTRGTYRLEARPDGGTRVTFELDTVEPTKFERLLGPINGPFLRRANRKALLRLAKQLRQG
jgi:hypothetical protein